MIGLDYAINIKEGSFGAIGEAKGEVEGLDNAVKRTNESFGGMSEKLGEIAKMMVAAFAVEKIIEFGSRSHEAFEQYEQNRAQLEAGIASTGGIAGVTMEELTKQADELSKITLFTPAQTMQAQKLALTFGNIRGVKFDETVRAVENLATRMGGDGPADLKGSSIQLGKALQDPIKGVGKLMKIGVDFSEAQRDMIKTMVEHGNIVGAQKLILKEIAFEFGGSAEAARKAKGSIGDLAMETNYLQVELGGLIDQALQPLAHALVEGIHWAKAHKGELKAMGMTALVIAGAFTTYKLTILALELPMTIMTAAQWALNVAMDANPIGLIITGVAALAAGFIWLYHNSDIVTAGFNGMLEVAKELKPLLMDIGEILLGMMTGNLYLMIKGYKDAFDDTKKFLANGGFEAAYNKGYDRSMAESKKKEDEEAKKNGTVSDLLHPKTDNPTGKAYSVGGKGGGDSTTVSGGSSVRNVQVTIGKLVERIEVHTTNIQGANASDIKRQLTELLVSAVHDSELALGSQ